jgi:hypothetical protein
MNMTREEVINIAVNYILKAEISYKEQADLWQAYPIGSIYIGVTNINPDVTFGGQWVKWGEGRVPVSVDTADTDFNTVEKTGGAKALQQHNHTTNNTTATNQQQAAYNTGNDSPDHSHTTFHRNTLYRQDITRDTNQRHGVCFDNQVNPPSNAPSAGASARHQHSIGAHNHTQVAHNHTVNNTGTGNSQNLQPYITCFMWKRIT